MALALLAFDTQAVLKSSSGQRKVDLDGFWKGPGETVIRSDELLTGFILKDLPDLTGSAYIKLGMRKTLEISLVNVAVMISLEEKNRTIKEARVALGAVAPTPMRALSAEKLLIGSLPDESLVAKAAAEAAKESRPIDDFRGSAEYRRWMVEVLTKRALNQALENVPK
jgi:carbon-monoxide dehydrogenase medium subunit